MEMAFFYLHWIELIEIIKLTCLECIFKEQFIAKHSNRIKKTHTVWTVAVQYSSDFILSVFRSKCVLYRRCINWNVSISVKPFIFIFKWWNVFQWSIIKWRTSTNITPSESYSITGPFDTLLQCFAAAWSTH